MELKVLNEEGVASSTIQVHDKLLTTEVNKNALYEAIKNERAYLRQGTHSTKTRAEVSGGNSKPWRQKGTGRARAGSTRSPVWVGGGKTQTPKPRDYSYRIPKKLKRLAFLSVFSMKHTDAALKIVDDLTVDAPKTKRLAGMIAKVKKEGSRKVAFVIGKSESTGKNYENLAMSLRNIKDLKLINADSLSVHPLFYADEIILTKTAMLKVNDTMSKYLKG